MHALLPAGPAQAKESPRCPMAIVIGDKAATRAAVSLLGDMNIAKPTVRACRSIVIDGMGAFRQATLVLTLLHVGLQSEY